MLVKDIYTTDLVTSSKENSILYAAKLMEDANTGTVIIVREEKNKHKPIGIITDRDIAVKYVAREMNSKTKLEDLMSNAITVDEEMGVEEALKKMRSRRIRRTPVIDQDGFLTGMISMDDILLNLYREMADVATIIQNELPEEME